MEPPRTESERDRPQVSFGATVAIVTGMVVVVVGLSVLAALVGGMWLDRALGTRPAFTIGLMVIAGPFSLYIIYRLTLMATRRMKPTAPMQSGKATRKYEDGGNDE